MTTSDARPWGARAACRDLDPDLFFVPNLTEARAAIEVCSRCDVRRECLEYAVEEDIGVGVWGGLTERQRRAYARRPEVA